MPIAEPVLLLAHGLGELVRIDLGDHLVGDAGAGAERPFLGAHDRLDECDAAGGAEELVGEHDAHERDQISQVHGLGHPHGHPVLLVGAGRCAHVGGRSGQHLDLAQERRGRVLGDHEAGVVRGRAGQVARQAEARVRREQGE